MTGRVVVVGSLHYDIMVETPARPRRGETVTGTRWFPKCGGKGGNQAVAAARHGADTAFIGAVGTDGFGEALLANLDRAGVDRRHVRRLATGSGMSVALLEPDGDYGAVIVPGANRQLAPEALDEAAPLLRAADVLMLQNELPEPVSLQAARLAREGQARILLNAAPARPLDPGWSGLIDILLVNALEAEALGGKPVTSRATAADAARRLLDHAQMAIVTAGGEGVALARRDGTALQLPAHHVAVHSTHGAGDAFAGALAAALAMGEGLETALSRANVAAARLVATPEDERAP
ncbi:MAG: ribokinase [Alphaproteobacteria bacterium]|nr:MAG: ribokinase [Alphaproteobacteria bacterium]